MTDVSDLAVGAMLQHYSNSEWCLISYFSKKLQPAETRYSTFDRELLYVYLAIKHSCHFVEGHQFHVRTDHKPLMLPLSSCSDRYTPWQACHLDYFSQFTTDYIQYIGMLKLLTMLLPMYCQGWKLTFSLKVLLQLLTLWLWPGLSVVVLNSPTYCLHPPLLLSISVKISSFVQGWISHFGVPSTVTTDCGHQFESALWENFMHLLGSKWLCTIAYDPVANSLTECFADSWKHLSNVLSTRLTGLIRCLVLLGIRTALEEDL